MKNGKTITLVSLLLLSFMLAACSRAAQQGDIVGVTYVGTLQNGTIFDTNDPKFENSFNASASHFQPFLVQIGKHSVLKDFEQALIGMHEGETKQIHIKAVDAYGGYDASKQLSVPKKLTFPLQLPLDRIVQVSKQGLLNYSHGNLSIGTIFETQSFLYNVTSIKGDNVTLYKISPTNDTIMIPNTYWQSRLVNTTPQAYVYEAQVKDGDQYNLPTGPYVAHLNATDIIFTTLLTMGEQFQSSTTTARVTTETPSALIVDFNNPLAGEDLFFNITVNSVSSGVK